MGITGAMLCDTRMRTRFPTWQNALIAQRHPLSRCLAITLMVVAAYPNWAVRAATRQQTLPGSRWTSSVPRISAPSSACRSPTRTMPSSACGARWRCSSPATPRRSGADRLKGRAAIRRYLLTTWGSGREGLPAGGLHTTLEDAPVLNLSADGKTAKAAGANSR